TFRCVWCKLGCINVDCIQIVGPELIIGIKTNALVLPFHFFAVHFPYSIPPWAAILADVVVGITFATCPPPSGTNGRSVVLHDTGLFLNSVIDMRMACEDVYR